MELWFYLTGSALCQWSCVHRLRLLSITGCLYCAEPITSSWKFLYLLQLLAEHTSDMFFCRYIFRAIFYAYTCLNGEERSDHVYPILLVTKAWNVDSSVSYFTTPTYKLVFNVYLSFWFSLAKNTILHWRSN